MSRKDSQKPIKCTEMAMDWASTNISPMAPPNSGPGFGNQDLYRNRLIARNTKLKNAFVPICAEIAAQQIASLIEMAK